MKRILFELPMASPEETRGAGEQPFDRAQAGAQRVPTQGAGAAVERESREGAEAEAAHGAAQPAAAAPQAGFSPSLKVGSARNSSARGRGSTPPSTFS